MQEAVDLVTSPHRMRGGTGDLGMNPHTDSADTKDVPETNTHRMAPSSLFPTMAPTKTSGDSVVFGEYVFLSGASTQDPIGNGIY